MPGPRPVTVDLPAGQVFNGSKLENEGRWVECEKIRFVRGKPEKLGGCVKWMDYQFLGIARGGCAWSDLTGRGWISIGTERRLYAFDLNRTPFNITPFKSPASPNLTNPFAIVNTSNIVTVTWTTHNLGINQGFHIAGATNAGGLNFNGDWTVLAVPDANHFTFQHTSAANVTNAACGGTPIVITPEINIGALNPTEGLGYGSGPYGGSFYGTVRAATIVTVPNRSWSFAHMGKLLAACPLQGEIYWWDPTNISVKPRAETIASIPGAVDTPGAALGIFFTDERYLVAYGASPDATTNVDSMLLRWADQNSLTFWTPGEVGHTANQRRLTYGKSIIAGTFFNNRTSLIWTDAGVYSMLYTGGTFTYDTRVLGQECGLIGPMAFSIARDRAFWMGNKAFYMLAGSVARIPNSDAVAEWIFARIRPQYGVKCVASFTPRFNEVWFFFVTGESIEPNMYAIVRLDTWEWVVGNWTRTTVVRFEGDDQNPIMFGDDSFAWEHETGKNDGDFAMLWRLRSGPIRLNEGEQRVHVKSIIPDLQRQVGRVNLKVIMREYPNDEESDYDWIRREIPHGKGVVDFKADGRMCEMEFHQALPDGDFRLGKPQFVFRAGGKGNR